MKRKIIIIGAGIIGASIAYQLRDHDVTVVDASRVAGAASGRSFGWINASFFANEAHFRLRAEAIAAWRRLSLGVALRWSGALWWEEQGAGLSAMAERLAGLGYAVETLSHADIARLEPAITAPAQALRFASEGVAEPATVTQQLLTASGAQLITGSEITGFATLGGRVTGVTIGAATMQADQVIVAAGTGSARLLNLLGHNLPMLHRPGLLVRTTPMPPVLSHILVGPMGEVRQEPDGRILCPAAINHQADSADSLPPIEDAKEAVMARLRDLLPGQSLAFDSVQEGLRPVPQDGLPVVGTVQDGLYLAVMHSGVTLAALMGEYVARDVMGGTVPALAPYRIARFNA